jgi:hypothetical protein
MPRRDIAQASVRLGMPPPDIMRWVWYRTDVLHADHLGSRPRQFGNEAAEMGRWQPLRFFQLSGIG